MQQNLYYQQNFEKLEMYQRLIQYWSMIFDRRENFYVLDNMNFNISVFPEIITNGELTKFHQIEPGYTSPDGYMELNLLIRELEYARLIRNASERSKHFRKLVDQAGIGLGNGCTNVVNNVINSIIKLLKKRFEEIDSLPEVILILPNYTVYTAQLSNFGERVIPKYVYTKRKNNFLPTYDEITEAITEKTAAVVITYPNNPAQSTYEGESVSELKKIVHLCQEKEIFLIVDNIYQDLVFPYHREFTEVFSLTDSLEYVIKVYGCSKDTPFFSGYRTGYWFGDPRIMDIYKYFISSTENSLNTVSMTMFALNLYFKLLNLSTTDPTLDDMKFFSYGVFGFSQIVNQEQLYEKLLKSRLFKKYQERIRVSNKIQENAIKTVTKFVNGSKIFSDYINQNIGNVFFIKVNPEFFKGTDHELFNFLFDHADCGVLPGNVFGMPQIPGNVWFRMTLLHDHIENIINSLMKVEEALFKRYNCLKTASGS